MKPPRPAEVSIAFDLCGCPNRCRHCWLGHARAGRMDHEHIREAFVRARGEAAAMASMPHVRYFRSSLREPDYCANYRELYDMEVELNQGARPFQAYELLSVWRLAGDPGYAKWARSIGTRRCQITLFGATPAVNDWGYGRRGAHADLVAATDACIEAGIVPRWQVFQTKRAMPELDELLRLVDTMDLHARVRALGDEFVVFMHDPTPTGAARDLEHVRITSSDVATIPHALRESTERHFGAPVSYATEAEWIRSIARDAETPYSPRIPGEFWFFVTADWSVYPNYESLEPWWRLGNLRSDGFVRVARTYLTGDIPALRAAGLLTEVDLGTRYGNPASDLVYMSRADLTALWFERHCRELCSQGVRSGRPRRPRQARRP